MRNTAENDSQYGLVEGKEWDVIIKPKSRWMDLDLKTVWEYKDLVWVFFKRDFVSVYKQTVLGPIWYLIQPIVTALTFYIIFGKIADLSTEGIPPILFYMSGIITWTYFSTSISNNAEVFSKNANLFSKVYFPRLVVPISIVMSAVVALFIQFILLIIILIASVLTEPDLYFPWATLWLFPIVVLYVAILGLSVGIIVAALTVRYRDLAYASGFMVQMWMYATPIVYPLSSVPDKYQILFSFNPMAMPVEMVRSILFYRPMPSLELMISNCTVTILLAVVGLLLFTRAEKIAVDTI